MEEISSIIQMLITSLKSIYHFKSLIFNHMGFGIVLVLFGGGEQRWKCWGPCRPWPLFAAWLGDTPAQGYLLGVFRHPQTFNVRAWLERKAARVFKGRSCTKRPCTPGKWSFQSAGHSKRSKPAPFLMVSCNRSSCSILPWVVIWWEHIAFIKLFAFLFLNQKLRVCYNPP